MNLFRLFLRWRLTKLRIKVQNALERLEPYENPRGCIGSLFMIHLAERTDDYNEAVRNYSHLCRRIQVTPEFQLRKPIPLWLKYIDM